MRNTLWLATLPILLLSSLCAQDMSAQDISGNWQGTLKDGATELRLIVEISKGETGGWKALLFSLDQASDDIPVDSVALKDSMVTLNIPAIGGSYEGKLSADATLITGQWTQGSAAPLDFKRATKETAWDRGHDTSPHTTQFITVD